MGSIPAGSTKKKRPHGLFFLVSPTGIPFPRDLSRRVRKFAAIRKPDEADAVFNFNKALPMIYAVTIHNVFRVFPSGLNYILYRPFGLFFLVLPTGIPFPRGLSRRVRKFSAKPKT